MQAAERGAARSELVEGAALACRVPLAPLARWLSASARGRFAGERGGPRPPRPSAWPAPTWLTSMDTNLLTTNYVVRENYTEIRERAAATTPTPAQGPAKPGKAPAASVVCCSRAHASLLFNWLISNSIFMWSGAASPQPPTPAPSCLTGRGPSCGGVYNHFPLKFIRSDPRTPRIIITPGNRWNRC